MGTENKHGDREGRHYYTRKNGREASYSSGDPRGRHVASLPVML